MTKMTETYGTEIKLKAGTMVSKPIDIGEYTVFKVVSPYLIDLSLLTPAHCKVPELEKLSPDELNSFLENLADMTYFIRGTYYKVFDEQKRRVAIAA